MNPNDIERQLARLSPAAPSAELHRRIANALDAGPAARPEPSAHGPWDWLSPLLWSALGAAAAVLVMLGFQRPADRTLVTPRFAARTAPVAASTREWIEPDSGGIEFDADRLPARRFHVMGIERHEWIDPGSGARMRVEAPREQTMAIPVSFQ